MGEQWGNGNGPQWGRTIKQAWQAWRESKPRSMAVKSKKHVFANICNHYNTKVKIIFDWTFSGILHNDNVQFTSICISNRFI
jgi:hypothetical protein